MKKKHDLKLKKQVLNNESKKIPVFIYRCNSTRDSTDTESDTDTETDTDNNFSSMSINSHVNFKKQPDLGLNNLNVVREQIKTNYNGYQDFRQFIFEAFEA